jgi:YD repeat-containing protein
MAEPRRVVTYQRSAAGDVLTRTEQATTDATGKDGMQAVGDGPPRVWRYTYYPDGQVKTVTGPRADVVDVTTYTYDTKGNLATVTNALGRVTRYSNYDAHGRVGRVDAPNGTYTTFDYDARGWLHAQTLHAGQASLQTVFDHDGVGQIKRVTLPDSTFTDYTYDDAHRLTRVSDGLGNSVVYTLDLTGNRIREQVNDPGGVLARQISRVYDVTGKLTSETGAAR